MRFSNIFPYRKGDSLSIRALKIITVAGPATFIGLFEIIRHEVFVEHQPMIAGNIVLLSVVTVCAYLFSKFIFGIIERAQQESIRRNQELAAINSVALAVSESLNLDVVLYRALDKVLQVTAAEAGEMFLLDEQTQEMVQKVHAGLFPEAFQGKTRFQIGEGFTGAVAQDGEPIIVSDLSQDLRLRRAMIKTSGFQSLASVPLKSKNSIIGVINIISLKQGHFTADDTRLLANIGNQIAVAIENARLHEKVQGMAALEERERIAREMHDGLAQVLSYVNVKSQVAKQLISSGKETEAKVQLTELESIAQEMYTDVREVILGLRTTTSPKKNLLSTLQEYIFHFSQLSDIRTDLEIANGRHLSFPATTELQVMRIIQEALTNIRKHAGASHAWVRISNDKEQVSITIEDNGHGFTLSRTRPRDWPRFGLKVMRERAESVSGTLDIESTPGQGTKVSLVIPLVLKVRT